MTDHIDEEGLAALAFGEPALPHQVAHLATCPACQAQVSAARAMVSEVSASLDTLADPEPELSRERQDVVFARIQEGVKPSPMRLVLPAFLVAMSALLVAKFGAHNDAWEWALLALLGAVVCALAYRTPYARFAIPAAFALSATLSILDAHGTNALSGQADMKCLVVEVFVGLAAAAMSIALVKREGSTLTTLSLATVLTGGALAGQAVILLTCPTQNGLVHGLASHTMGLVIAASLAWPISKLPMVRRT